MTQPPAELWFHDTGHLSRIEADCWSLLEASVQDAESDWRLPVFGTSYQGCCFQRSVVLRRTDVSTRSLVFHTDRRSAKVMHIRSNASVSLLFYDRQFKAQLSILAKASVVLQGPLFEEIWNTESASSLRTYLAPSAPGQDSLKPNCNLPESVVGRVPSRRELQEAIDNFAVIRCDVTSADWLLLQRDGNLRARFDYDGGELVRCRWLTP